MSKDFRQPLSNCLVFLQNLLSGNLTAQQIKVVNILIAQINLLLALVNDILDLKMIEDGLFEPKKQLFNPTKTLEFIKSMF